MTIPSRHHWIVQLVEQSPWWREIEVRILQGVKKALTHKADRG